MAIAFQLREEDIRGALRLALATENEEQASAAQVAAVLEYARLARGEWLGWRCPGAGPLTALALALVLPGRTALLISPSPGRNGIDAENQWRLIEAALGALAPLGLHYAQALIEPEEVQSAHVLKQSGFDRITAMLYLDRDSRYPWIEPPPAAAGRWVSFCDLEERRFEHTLARTYDSSLDCPELTGIRPIRDVLLGHGASGHFRPECWELLEIGGVPAGCILLADLPHLRSAEVAYMGVTPEFRNRGTGAVLLRRGLELARRIGAQRVTLAVDERNEPARKLYQQFNFAESARRAAFFFRWSGSIGGAVSK